MNRWFEVQAPSDLAGLLIGVEGDGPVTLEDAGEIVAELVLAEDIFACGPLTNAADVEGKIALVSRGACGFDDKYLNAQAAGAIAIVVFNDGADPTRVDPIAMGGISPGVTIPGIMISSVDGDALASSTDTLVGRLSPAIQEARRPRERSRLSCSTTAPTRRGWIRSRWAESPPG
ncbi:MAG: PA domain-containing protein [Myxococcota bacterium]